MLIIAAIFLACLATYAIFFQKITRKVHAIEIVQREYLPKESLDAFVSRVHREGKFKLLGWDISDTGEKGVYIVSYTIRRLNEDGFKTGDPVGYWFRVDTGKDYCEPVRPEGTITPGE
jgi:hypothetical protein